MLATYFWPILLMLLTVIVTFYSLFIYLTQHIPNSLSQIMMPKSEIRIIYFISNSFNHFNLRLEKLYVLNFNLLACGFLNFKSLSEWTYGWIELEIKNLRILIKLQNSMNSVDFCVKFSNVKFNAVFCGVKSISRALNLKQRKYQNMKSKKFNCLCSQTCCFIHYLWLFSIQIVTH